LLNDRFGAVPYLNSDVGGATTMVRAWFNAAMPTICRDKNGRALLAGLSTALVMIHGLFGASTGAGLAHRRTRGTHGVNMLAAPNHGQSSQMAIVRTFKRKRHTVEVQLFHVTLSTSGVNGVFLLSRLLP